MELTVGRLKLAVGTDSVILTPKSTISHVQYKVRPSGRLDKSVVECRVNGHPGCFDIYKLPDDHVIK